MMFLIQDRDEIFALGVSCFTLSRWVRQRSLQLRPHLLGVPLLQLTPLLIMGESGLWWR